VTSKTESLTHTCRSVSSLGCFTRTFSTCRRKGCVILRLHHTETASYLGCWYKKPNLRRYIYILKSNANLYAASEEWKSKTIYMCRCGIKQSSSPLWLESGNAWLTIKGRPHQWLLYLRMLLEVLTTWCCGSGCDTGTPLVPFPNPQCTICMRDWWIQNFEH